MASQNVLKKLEKKIDLLRPINIQISAISRSFQLIRTNFNVATLPLAFPLLPLQ